MAITATENVSFSNISANTAAFKLKGGKYGAVVHATSVDSVLQLQTLAMDGVTWVLVGSNFAADGPQTYDLPPGQYRIGITGATGVFFSLTRIPA